MEAADYHEPASFGPGRRLKNRAKLSTEEKVNIAHRVLVGHELQGDVARDFGVTRSRISQICTTVSNSHDALEVMHQAEEDKASRR